MCRADKRWLRGQRWLAHGMLVASLSLVISLIAIGDSRAQAAAPTQAAVIELEAAYLYKFVNYVEWPPEALRNVSDPIVIGVLNADPLADELKRLIRQKRVKGFAIRRLTPGDDLGSVHVLFIGDMERATEQAALASVRGKPVLTVSDSPRVFASGSMINFVLINQRLRFEVALLPVSQSRLRVRALMLTAAYRVQKEER